MNAQSMPPKPKIDASTLGRKTIPTSPSDQTFKDFLTDNDRHPERLDTFRDLANKNARWRTEWKFFASNVTGSVASMSPENQKRVEKLKKDLESEEFKNSNLE